MLEKLKEQVLEANLELVRARLVVLTWGNVSGRDEETGLVVIKPSGVPYNHLGRDDMVVVEPAGKVIEGERRPSTDTATHLALYRELVGVGGIVHTHSAWAAAWAQAGRSIPVIGTTHADLSPVAVPVTDAISAEEVAAGYEAMTGELILRVLAGRDPDHVPAVLVAGHGPFAWGRTPEMAVQVAVTLEEVARMSAFTVMLGGGITPLATHVVEQHFSRKHGPSAYYGQD